MIGVGWFPGSLGQSLCSSHRTLEEDLAFLFLPHCDRVQFLLWGVCNPGLRPLLSRVYPRHNSGPVLIYLHAPVLVCPALACAAWPILSPRLLGNAVYSFLVPLMGTESWKILLHFLTSWNSSILLLLCLSNMSLWEGCLVHSLVPPHGSATSWFYTVCWEEGRNCVTVVMGGENLSLGCQHENDFTETQRSGGSFYILPLKISQATVTWIITVESLHGQYSLGHIDSYYFFSS